MPTRCHRPLSLAHCHCCIEPTPALLHCTARCRRREGDLVDVVSEAEAAAQAAVAVGADSGDYGAKLVALLGELRSMRKSDKQAKAVIFSSWARWVGGSREHCGWLGCGEVVRRHLLQRHLPPAEAA